MKKEFQAKAIEMTGKRVDVDIAFKAVSVDKEKHTATFVMSTASIDRHGDIVEQSSWNLKHFLENPAFFWGHRSNEFPLGKWLSISLEVDPDIEGEMRLVGTAEFAVDLHPDIKRAWDHVVRGDLNMVSVGFIPHVVDYDEERDAFVLKSCELMECSLVGIGANRHALIKEVTPEKKLIEVKQELEESIEKTDPTFNRKMHGIGLLNKAIRQFKT